MFGACTFAQLAPQHDFSIRHLSSIRLKIFLLLIFKNTASHDFLCVCCVFEKEQVLTTSDASFDHGAVLTGTLSKFPRFFFFFSRFSS